jgi:hypothetical protein
MWATAVRDLRPAIQYKQYRCTIRFLVLTSPKAFTTAGAHPTADVLTLALKYMYVAKNAKVEINSRDEVMVYVDSD